MGVMGKWGNGVLEWWGAGVLGGLEDWGGGRLLVWCWLLVDCY